MQYGRKTKLPFSCLVGAVSNCAYAVRLETEPTGGRKCLFIFRIHHRQTAHVAPLGLRRRAPLPGYRHVAPLGLNESTNLFLFSRIRHSILKILKSFLFRFIGENPNSDCFESRSYRGNNYEPPPSTLIKEKAIDGCQSQTRFGEI